MPQADTLRTATRESLSAFAAALHIDYRPNWHHRLIARALERCVSGDQEWSRVLISLPPRHGKTLITSQMFPAWFLGGHRHENFIVATYGGEYADDLGRKARGVVSDPLYESIFNTKLNPESQAIARWELTNGSGFYAVSVGSALTGRGANCLIIDDAVKNREEADSEGARTRVWDWFLSTAYTRLEKNGKVVVIGTRWHEDDLIGRLQASGLNWRTLSFPAIAEHDEYDEFHLLSNGPDAALLRHEGEALWPEKYDLDRLLDIKRQVGTYEWASLYQQRPAPLEGALFKREYWRRYDLDAIKSGERSPPWTVVYQAWDTAVSAKKTSARSCCTTWGLTPSGMIFLLDVWKGKVEFPDLKRQAIALARQWSPRMIWVEEQQTGGPLIAELKRDTRIPVKGVRLRGDKETRARIVSAIAESGKVAIPGRAPWVDSYVDELAMFPSGLYADQVDSTSLGLRMLVKQENQYAQQYDRSVSSGPEAPVSIFGR